MKLAVRLAILPLALAIINSCYANGLGRSLIVEKVCGKGESISYNKKLNEYYLPPGDFKTLSYPDPNNSKSSDAIYYYFLDYNGGKCVRLITHPGPKIRNHCESAEVVYTAKDDEIIVTRGDYTSRVRPHQLEKYLTLCDY